MANTLNEPGAPPARGVIPLSVPTLAGNEWKYIKECLDTNWVSSAGPFVDRFEREIAVYLRVPHAVAVVNGTAALQVALEIAGVKPGDEVVIPALTFIATANAVRYAGATPAILDVEPHYWQLDPAKLERFLRQHCERREGGTYDRQTGSRISAIVPVHLLGHPCDMDSVLELAREFDLAVVEDAAEALGTIYKGNAVGTLGDIGCLSFNGNKTITCGGGGMIVTHSDKLAERARYLTTQAKDNAEDYVHNEVGYNYRMTNIAAALGCAQMEQLDHFLVVKRRNAQAYTEGLANIPGIKPMQEAAWAKSGFWLYTVLVDPQEFGMTNRELQQVLREAKIQARLLWQPMHQSPAHNAAPRYDVEAAEDIYREALSLPSSTGLTDADIARVVATIKTAAA